MMMNVICFSVVITLSKLAGSSAQKCSLCEAKMGEFRFPIPQAMSLRDFLFYYARNGVQMSELYYVYQNPKPFEPYYNYKTNYTVAENGTYQESIVSDELGLVGNVQPRCIRVNTTLTPTIVDQYRRELNPTANFLRGAGSEMQTFWSSCPSKYVWTMKCRDWSFGNRFCPLNKVYLGLSVPKVGQNAPDNIPWSSILRDLKKANMFFGGTDLYWAYTYGESKYCT